MLLSDRLERHLGQIEAAAGDIANIQFGQPGIFTNSQINSPPITALIRDTSAYERVLFSSSASRSPYPTASSSKKFAALNNLLDNNIIQHVHNVVRSTQRKGEVDVEIILKGAENLLSIYPTPGLEDRIQDLRQRYCELFNRVNLYEELVTAQRNQLDLQRGVDYHAEPEPEPVEAEPVDKAPADLISDADIEAEEVAIRELEARKAEIEAEIRELDRRTGSMISSQSY